MSIKKQIYLLVIVSIGLLAALLTFMARTPPTTDNAVPVLLVLLLLYALSASVIALLFALSAGTAWIRRTTLILMLASIPPAFIVLASLRQATALDLFILFVTIVLIAWYATYKK